MTTAHYPTNPAAVVFPSAEPGRDLAVAIQFNTDDRRRICKRLSVWLDEIAEVVVPSK